MPRKTHCSGCGRTELEGTPDARIKPVTVVVDDVTKLRSWENAESHSELVCPDCLSAILAYLGVENKNALDPPIMRVVG